MSHKNNISPYLSSEGILIVRCTNCDQSTVQTMNSNCCFECYYKKRRRYYNEYNKSESQRKVRTSYMKKYREDPVKNKKHLLSVVKYNNSTIGKKRRRDYEKKEAFKKWSSDYYKNKRKTDFDYRFRITISSRIRQALKNNRKSRKTKELVGLSIPELKKYLESKFKPGMSWENYGINGWHIDHIKPCASFDLSKEDEQRKCFHYTNLQPLWAIENRLKSDKYAA